MIEHRFGAMGTEVRLLLAPAAAGLGPLLEDEVAAFAAALTRFDAGSELSRLNADPRAAVPASPLLRRAVTAALTAAHATDGLVDPTLLGPLERAGYRRSRVGVAGVPAAAALAAAPSRRPAAPHPEARWRAIAVDDEAGVIRRPPGLRLDLGGSAKGLCADLLAARLAAHGPFAVDCGGDARLGGAHRVEVATPFGGGAAHALDVDGGAVATSGLGSRVWRDATGAPAHHLIDPATGRSAWTGLASATALAPTALAAEALAKAAFLSGPARARRLLRRGGGVLIHDDGGVEPVGRLYARVPLEVAA
jgi:thiamine biosynthesis lipoprotein